MNLIVVVSYLFVKNVKPVRNNMQVKLWMRFSWSGAITRPMKVGKEMKIAHNNISMVIIAYNGISMIIFIAKAIIDPWGLFL